MAKAEATTQAAPVNWEYAPAPQARDVVTIHPSYRLFVGGEFSHPASGEHLVTLNPATEEPLADVAVAGPRDVDMAVAAARRAYEQTWG